MNTPFRPI